MHNRPHILLLQIHHKIRVGRLLIRVIHTSEALDLAAARRSVDASPVGLLAVLERGSDADEEERTGLLNQVTGLLARILKGRNGCGDGLL